MVCEWGMSDRFGSASFQDLSNKAFGENPSYSPETLKQIDEEVFGILRKCQEKTSLLLSENKEKLVLISESLIEKETLSSEEIDTLLKQ
jgi:cell division protease FtsH